MMHKWRSRGPSVSCEVRSVHRAQHYFQWNETEHGRAECATSHGKRCSVKLLLRLYVTLFPWIHNIAGGHRHFFKFISSWKESKAGTHNRISFHAMIHPSFSQPRSRAPACTQSVHGDPRMQTWKASSGSGCMIAAPPPGTIREKSESHWSRWPESLMQGGHKR